MDQNPDQDQDPDQIAGDSPPLPAEPTDEPSEASRSSRLRLRDVAMTTRLAATVVAVCALSLLVSTLVGLVTGRSLSRDLDEERLLALQGSGAGDVAAQMRSLSDTASALAASPRPTSSP